MRRPVLTLAPAAALLLAAAGCGSSAEIRQRSDGVSLVVSSGSGSGMDARLRGSLVVLEGDCVGVDASGTQVLVAWPPGAEITTEGDLVLTLSGRDHALGEELQVAGGTVQVSESSALPALPDACAREEIFLVNDD